VKIRKLAGAVAATVISVGLNAGAVGPASATDNIQPFGVQEKVRDALGNPMIGYTVRNFMPSSDPMPHNGQLYEATLTVDAFGAWATPMIPMFNARAESSALYRVLPGSGPGGAVPPGGNSTGKLYFDVVGDVPNSVVYNDGVRDLLAWVGTPITATPGGAPGGGGSSSANGDKPNGSNAELGPFPTPDTANAGSGNPQVGDNNDAGGAEGGGAGGLPGIGG
jgi:Domain of unknown function (DUF1942)